jgi:hypothetical protein
MKTKSISTLILVSCILSYIPSIAGELDKPDKAEVIGELSRFTGLGGDVLGKVREENASLFENVNHAVFAIKAINMLAEAKDQDAAAEIAQYGLNYGLDKIKDRFLPVAVSGFVALASACKTALEVIRDYIFIPKFEEAIYHKYKESRLADSKYSHNLGDLSEESRETAFATATMSSMSGYYAVKSTMFEEMIKKRDLKKDSMGEKMIKDLERKIDDFWIKRMETRYQVDLLREQKEKLKAETWKIVAKDIDAIRTAANKPHSGGNEPDRFFITEKDIPDTWKYYPRGKNDFVINSGGRQSFSMVNPAFLKGLNEKKYPGGVSSYTLPDGSPAYPMPIDVGTVIYPKPASYDKADEIKKKIKPGGLSDFPSESVTTGGCGPDSVEGSFVCLLVKGKWVVELRVSGWAQKALQAEQAKELARRGKPGNYVDQTIATEDLARQLAKIVAARIPAK